VDRPGGRRVLQAEEGAQQFALRQVLDPHQLQDQEGGQQPQDV